MLLGIVIAIVLSFGVSANAAPVEGDEGAVSGGDTQGEDSGSAQDDLVKMQHDAYVAGEKYNNARVKLDQLNQDITGTVLKRADAEDNLKKAQANVDKQAVQVYRAGPLYFIDFLFGAQSFSDFADRTWFSIKALLGMQNDVQSWRDESDRLQQAAIDLDLKAQKQKTITEEAQNQRNQALDNANALLERINKLDGEDGSSSSSQDQLDTTKRFAQGLRDGLENGSEPDQVDPASVTTLLSGMNVQPERLPLVEDALKNFMQSVATANAAQQEANKASQKVADEVANMESSGDGTQAAPFRLISFTDGPQATPQSSDPQGTAPPQNGGTQPITPTGGSLTTPPPSLDPSLVGDAKTAQAAQDQAQQANLDVQQQAARLADALGQPAGGNQPLNPTGAPAGTVQYGNGQQTPVQYGGGQQAAQLNQNLTGQKSLNQINQQVPSAPGGGSGQPSGLPASYLGKPYQYGAMGPGAYSCSGLVSTLLAAEGKPWVNSPEGLVSMYPQDGGAGDTSPPPGAITYYTDGGGIYHVGWSIGGGMMIDANSLQGEVVQEPVTQVPGYSGWVMP